MKYQKHVLGVRIRKKRYAHSRKLMKNGVEADAVSLPRCWKRFHAEGACLAIRAKCRIKFAKACHYGIHLAFHIVDLNKLRRPETMVPVTSISLLKVLGEDSQSPRWREFLRMYASTIDGFLFKHFPTVDAEDVVQETLRALVEKLPLYEYDPDTKGHFRNYLIGIVRFKAIEQLKRRKREADLRVELEANAQFEWECEKQSYSVDLRNWQREAYEAALAQFMADKSISTRDKEIFRRVALQGESPEDVAAIFDIKRNNVDQIKARMVAKLKELALRYAGICDDAVK